MTRTARLFGPLLIVALVTGCGLHHSWAWKLADLDRNSLGLGLYRGADTPDKLAGWVEYGTVVEASGTSPDEGELTIVVQYEREHLGWLGSERGVEQACYEFTADDRYGVEFDETDC